MKTDSTKLLQDIAAFLLAAPQNPSTVKTAIEMVRRERGYCWLGVYKIVCDDFVIIAGTGNEPPTYARFPKTQGLCGVVAESRETLFVPDVREDPRWLPSFWTTLSEIVVPIIRLESDRLVGVLNVESEKKNAFDEDDRDFLEHVAVLLARKITATRTKQHAPAG